MLCSRRISRILCSRLYSTAQKHLELITDEKTKISTLILQKPPVNSMNTEFLSEIGNIFDELENNKCRGLILTSRIPNIFSAGLDLLELYGTDARKLETFWLTLRGTWLKLFTTSFPTAALINGHAIAGGCLFAMSCEYRVIQGSKYTIGLNEAQIGIAVPQWFADVMQSLIGSRKTEMALLTGNMFSSEEALQIGLVDKVVQNESEAKNEIDAFLKKVNAVDVVTRGVIKRYYRKDIVERFLKGRDEEVKIVVSSILAPQTQQQLKLYFESLKRKN